MDGLRARNVGYAEAWDTWCVTVFLDWGYVLTVHPDLPNVTPPSLCISLHPSPC